MARPSHIPKFGNWDPNDHMPYTTVFDTARAQKGRIVNPNDPMENGSSFEEDKDPSVVDSPATRPPARHQRKASRDDSEYGFNSKYGPNSGTGTEDYAGQENKPNYERAGNGSGLSPSHPQAYAGRAGRKPGSTSPLVQKKADEGAAGIPNRNRQPERHAAPLPKFGDWNVNNLSTGEGYTEIFENARGQKSGGGGFRTQDSPLKSDKNTSKTRPESHERCNWFRRCFH